MRNACVTLAIVIGCGGNSGEGSGGDTNGEGGDDGPPPPCQDCLCCDGNLEDLRACVCLLDDGSEEYLYHTCVGGGGFVQIQRFFRESCGTRRTSGLIV